MGRRHRGGRVFRAAGTLAVFITPGTVRTWFSPTSCAWALGLLEVSEQLRRKPKRRAG